MIIFAKKGLVLDEEWVEIPAFPDYLINRDGVVVNATTGRRIGVSINAQGFVKIGLYVGARQVTRSLAMLVLDTFEPDYDPRFNSVIHLDGNRGNCQLDNLMRRPRWFAIRFHSQLRDGGHYDTTRSRLYLVGDVTNKIYTFREAAMTFGTLYYDMLKSAVENEDVYPIKNLFFRFAEPVPLNKV